jgi:peptidoglycan biosynthesis protein MviN/MurJ (putative lipid II flippase)
VLLKPLQEGGPGIVNTLTSCLNTGLLLFALRKKLGSLELEPLRKKLPPLALVAICAGLVAWEGWRWWEYSLGHANLALKIGAVFVPAGTAGLVYWLLALALRIPAAKEMMEFALARFKKRN